MGNNQAAWNLHTQSAPLSAQSNHLWCGEDVAASSLPIITPLYSGNIIGRKIIFGLGINLSALENGTLQGGGGEIYSRETFDFAGGWVDDENTSIVVINTEGTSATLEVYIPETMQVR